MMDNKPLLSEENIALLKRVYDGELTVEQAKKLVMDAIAEGKYDMKKKTEIKIVCRNCGNQAPYDAERSTENWKVYDTSKPCEKCGTHNWHPKIGE
jgi:predicted nucleic-acid-binding Zn-ribbon protein